MIDEDNDTTIVPLLVYDATPFHCRIVFCGSLHVILWFSGTPFHTSHCSPSFSVTQISFIFRRRCPLTLSNSSILHVVQRLFILIMLTCTIAYCVWEPSQRFHCPEVFPSTPLSLVENLELTLVDHKLRVSILFGFVDLGILSHDYNVFLVVHNFNIASLLRVVQERDASLLSAL